ALLAGVVVDAVTPLGPNLHPRTAHPAQDAALQEALLLTEAPRGPAAMKLCHIVLEDLLVGLKLVPGNVAGVGIFYEYLPMLARRREHSPRVGFLNDATAPIDKGSGIAGVVEDLRDPSRID